MDHRLALALKYLDQGLPDAAWHAVHDLARAPDAAREVLHLAAVLSLQTGHAPETLVFTDRLIAQDAGDADAHLLRAQALREDGRFEDAAAAFAALGALRPPDAAFHFNLAQLHHHAGRLDDSETAWRAALALDPGNAGAWNNLGLLLDDAGRPDDARAAYEKAIALAPQVSATHNNLGSSLAGQGCYAAAAGAYARALEIDPRNVAALINLGVAELEQGRLDTARRTFDAALAQGPLNRDAADNRLYLDLYAETDPARICARHRAWGHELAFAPPPFAPVRHKPLKVGYVSADFRRHSVSFFVEALLRHHDPRAADVFCYSGVTQPDAVTARLQSLVPNWRDTAGWDDERLRTAIRDDGIDVLVDLSGHTNGNRLAMFARRGAPVQVTALGYPATTGVGAMDFRLCDAITDPPGTEAFSTEQLMRLHALHCFTPPAGAPAPAGLPLRRRGYVTFGSFNKLAKVSDACIALWARLLRAVPDSRLLLKTKPLAEAETRAAFARRFGAHGISPDRLDLRGWQPGDADHLAAYGQIDIALDTFPYNGTTTTCEALWMGAPVVSLAGRGHAARVGASLLTGAGLRHWCASTEEEFLEIATKAAGDTEALAALRAGLRDQVRGSRLCDGLAYTRDVESAFRAMCES